MDKIVREVRKACDIRLVDMASHLNMKPSNYSNMECGKLITSKTPELQKKALSFLSEKLRLKIESKKNTVNNIHRDIDELKNLSEQIKNHK